jgi:hypothetical protein
VFHTAGRDVKGKLKLRSLADSGMMMVEFSEI